MVELYVFTCIIRLRMYDMLLEGRRHSAVLPNIHSEFSHAHTLATSVRH